MEAHLLVRQQKNGEMCSSAVSSNIKTICFSKLVQPQSHLPPVDPWTTEAIPEAGGPLDTRPSMVIFDWLLMRCFSSAFSASSWSISACSASMVSSNSLVITVKGEQAGKWKRGGGIQDKKLKRKVRMRDLFLVLKYVNWFCSVPYWSYFSFFFSRARFSSSLVWIFSTRSSASLVEVSSFFSSRLSRTFASLSSSPWRRELC